MIVREFSNKVTAERWLDHMETKGYRPLDVVWTGSRWSAACSSRS